MSGDRWLCGWRVASDLPLPDLPPWTGADREPDLEVRLGEVPDHLPAAVHSGPLLQVASDGTCRYALDGIAAFLVEGGRRVTVQPRMAPDAPDIRVLLLGSVFGFLCHQRGLLPLHAGCVEVGGRAVALAGASGMGKSTLTAAFRRRGHPVLADDVTVVHVAAEGGPRVLPAFPRLKLWRDAIDGLGLRVDGLERSRLGLEKFNLPLAVGFRAEPLPLAAIYMLETVNDRRHAGIVPLRGVDLMVALTGIVYRRMMAIHAGRQGVMMAGLIRLASLPVSSLARVPGLSGLDDTVAEIAARHPPARDGGSA